MRFIDKVERKLGRFAIPHLMLYITIAYAIGYIFYLVGGANILNVLALNAERILHGEVWRIVTFIVQPPTNSMPLFFIITLYFYYIIGSVLEKQWGAFKFNIYFFSGMILHVIAAIIIYLIFHVNMLMSVYYLNLSLFMAYAIEAPNNMIMLFFIIPFKTRWLAIIDAVYIGLTIVLGYLSFAVEFPYEFQSVLASMGIRLHPTNATAAAIAMLNFFIYFLLFRPGKKSRSNNNYSGYNRQNVYRGNFGGTGGQNYNTGSNFGGTQGTYTNQARHRCCICGITDTDSPDEEFRFCTSCEGSYEYCSKHLTSHRHVHRTSDGGLSRD